MHACRASGLKGNNRKPSLVYARLYTRTYWCPSKETCKACVVIVPRPEDDIIKDFPLEDILKKNNIWKSERQRLIISTLDFDKNKIVCTHCFSELTPHTRTDYAGVLLRHRCSANKIEGEDGRFPTQTSNLFYVHECASIR